MAGERSDVGGGDPGDVFLVDAPLDYTFSQRACAREVFDAVAAFNARVRDARAAGLVVEARVSVRIRPAADPGPAEAPEVREVGGRWNAGNEPSDVDVPKAGGGLHRIEVKSKTFGNKQQVSVHAGALYDKVKDQEVHPEDTWHTVAIDRRHSSEGGAHAGFYSGHDVYYKRAVGPYALSKMHKVKDEAELKRLMAAPEHELPEAARGAFPKGGGLEKLKAAAAKDRSYNNGRSKQRKKRIGRAAYNNPAGG